MTRIMPIISVVLIIVAFIVGRLSDSGSQSYADYYRTSADVYATATRLDSPPADANDPERWAQVLALYREVFDAYPDSPYADDALFSVASRIDVAEDADTAFVLYRRLVNDYPDSQHAPAALNGIGVTHFQQGDFDRALVVFDRFLEQYRSHSLGENVMLNHAICQLEKGAYDTSIAELHAFSERYPQTDHVAATVFYVGRAHFEKQDFVAARSNFQNIVSIDDPEYAPAAQFNIGQAYFHEREYDEAINAYRRTLELYPDSDSAEEAAFASGWAFERQQKYAESVTELRSAIDRHPDSPNTPAAVVFMARIYLDGLDDPENAIATYRTIADGVIPLDSIETDLRSAYDVRRNAQYSVGKIYEDRREFASAVAEYDTLLAQFQEPHSDPKHASNLIDEAYIVDLRRSASE